MKTLLLTILSMAGAVASFSQTTVFSRADIDPVSTTVPPDSRFEILQLNFDIRSVLKVDKYLGTVSQIVFGDYAYQSWSRIERLKHPADTITDTHKVNYQLFAGTERKFTYVVNLNTGATWVLTFDKKGRYIWDPIFKEE